MVFKSGLENWAIVEQSEDWNKSYVSLGKCWCINLADLVSELVFGLLGLGNEV